MKRGNKLCLKFPADGFGAKGADLLQLFEVLQQKWTLLMEGWAARRCPCSAWGGMLPAQLAAPPLFVGSILPLLLVY